MLTPKEFLLHKQGKPDIVSLKICTFASDYAEYVNEQLLAQLKDVQQRLIKFSPTVNTESKKDMELYSIISEIGDTLNKLT